MNEKPEPRFSVGEVAILQPPHPTARHLWGYETTILSIHWTENADDAMGGKSSGWGYHTDIPAPPPTNLPEDQHSGWLWCEYDLKKKHEPGDDFAVLMEVLKTELV